MARFGSLGEQYLDDDGKPLINGEIEFFESGSTTQKDTFADVGLSIKNANPVPLTAAGRQPNIFFNGVGRAVLRDSLGNQIDEIDPVGGTGETGPLEPWNSITVYNIPDRVIASDNGLYRSLTNGNQGNDPTGDPANWTLEQIVATWNSSETYSADAIVIASNGLLYTSIGGSNVNNDPTTSPAKWRPAATVAIPSVINAAAKLYAYENLG